MKQSRAEHKSAYQLVKLAHLPKELLCAKKAIFEVGSPEKQNAPGAFIDREPGGDPEACPQREGCCSRSLPLKPAAAVLRSMTVAMRTKAPEYLSPNRVLCSFSVTLGFLPVVSSKILASSRISSSHWDERGRPPLFGLRSSNSSQIASSCTDNSFVSIPHRRSKWLFAHSRVSLRDSTGSESNTFSL